MSEREQWGSRIGLILAMAGNAVGIGNFLRFPVQAATNGGGAFMIPYFIAFVLLAIPLMWVEWTIGRHGGRYGHGSLPGMFDVMWKHPIAKYLGIFGLFTSTIIMIYYTYLVSWMLGFSFFSMTGEYMGIGGIDEMANFLGSYSGSIEQGHFHSTWPAYLFLLVTVAFNFYILSKGIRGGIEKFAKVALPLLFLFATAIAIWVFTVGTPDPSVPGNSVMNGLAFIWNPNFSELSNAKIWLAAAGQVFFTLSVGMGTLQAYASYLKSKQDVALSGLATASVNEFAEVILGGTIAIPIAVAFFGIVGTQEIASEGAFNLGIVSMGVIFQEMGNFGQSLGFMWFFLLFFAGVTSSVAMAQPLISFLKEQFKFNHQKATALIGLFILATTHLAFFWNRFGFVDEMDYWAGTFMLVIVSLIEIIIFGWFFGIDKGWKEMNRGADIKIPNIFKFIIKYVTPGYLFLILGFWTVQEAIPTLNMEKLNTPTEMFSVSKIKSNDIKSYLDDNNLNLVHASIISTSSKSGLDSIRIKLIELNAKKKSFNENKTKVSIINMNIENQIDKYIKTYLNLNLNSLRNQKIKISHNELNNLKERYLALRDTFNKDGKLDESLLLLTNTLSSSFGNPDLYKVLLFIRTAELHKDNLNQSKIPYVWLARLFMLIVTIILIWMVKIAWKRNKPNYENLDLG